MRTQAECISCFQRQALTAARLSTSDPDVQQLVMDKAARLLSRIDLSKSPPENAVALYGLIAELTGDHDPFARLKRESNDFALQLREMVQERIDEAENPLYTAVRYAIAANIIDYGASHEFDALQTLSRCLEEPLEIDDFAMLHREVTGPAGKNILYLADNCGEIVFDSLLVKQLQQLGHTVTVAVRGKEILNDATMESAAEAGMDALCRVISNGSSCPGTPVGSCSRELQDAFAHADIIISKGQGNFETLSETDRPIYFLLTVKCAVVANHLARLRGIAGGRITGTGEPVLVNKEGLHAGATD